jgi:Ser/Thr protein kinase RdoA (MazF antagonist)
VTVLRKLAREVLTSYDIAPRRIVPAPQSFNSVFRVVADSGTFALRIGSSRRIHAEGTVETEGTWLTRLADCGIHVPRLRRNQAGRFGTEVDDGQGPRTCALSDWVAGRSLRSRVTAPTAAALGDLAARLHGNAEAWSLPDAAAVLAADRVLYWRLPGRLTDSDIPFHSLFADALDEAQTVLDGLWRAPPHQPFLLHGDLTPANVIRGDDGRLVPIDFQDLVWGLDVQDVAITLTALQRAPGGARLVDAFRDGYAARRPWPDLPPPLLDALLATRALNQINLAVNSKSAAELAEYLPPRAERLRLWLASRGKAA